MGTYRTHAIALVRGASITGIVAELFGNSRGDSQGKGGSMHLYSKARKMWGGSGIVGATGPIGAGLAFANLYLAKRAFPVPVSVGMYGDGAANQGQIWEAANMAKLWKLPAIFLIENNQYGMGTSVDRSSANTEYYKQGGVAIPGLKADGMDVLAVKAAVGYARQWASSGKGPMYLELKTYRYHGHSMSDPGITYRSRDEVERMRATRDCIELVKSRLQEAGWATADELKATEKRVRDEVAAAVEEARAGAPCRPEALDTDIYWKEQPPYVRMPDRTASKRYA
jgi:pyruvate dehydrogenase E1 component alpha subunit